MTATCIFDGIWWLVLVDLINVEEKDVTCKFMHPHGPTNNFHWLHTDDMGYVPFNKFIMTVETSQCWSNSWQFFIKEQELKHTNSFLEIWNNMFLITDEDIYNILSYDRRNTNLMHFQMIQTVFDWIYH